MYIVKIIDFSQYGFKERSLEIMDILKNEIEMKENKGIFSKRNFCQESELTWKLSVGLIKGFFLNIF